MFKTNDNACHRIHKDDVNLMHVIYQIISAYFEDDCADVLTNESIMTAILDKDALVDYAVEYGEFMYQAGTCSDI